VFRYDTKIYEYHFHVYFSGLKVFILFYYREYLETVCMHLYDMLRPLVIHMKHFETLVELCTILRIEILQDYVSEDGN